MTRMLILSFSPIRGDARVLKQVEEFARDHDVVTCGYGPAPDGVAEHIRIPDEARVDARHPKLVLLRWYRALYSSLPGVAEV
ncbi:glycosyltransferase family 1 protein, partial [Microbacterium sp. OR21]